MIGPACDRVPMPGADREAITAWRCWFVLPEEYLLRPIYKRGLAWKPRETLEAVCPDELHEVPADRCKCGVWAASGPAYLHEVKWTSSPPKGVDPLPGVLVVGQISMWGRLIEHERGWRSSHAYPKHLYVFADDPVLAAVLRDTYLVPVEYGDKARELAELFPKPPAEEETTAAPRRLLPMRKPATPSTSTPSAPNPTQIASAVLLELAQRLPTNLQEIATLKIERLERWWFHVATEAAVGRAREELAKARASLERATARGGHKLYGAEWKSALRLKVQEEARSLVSKSARLRTVQGNTTGARRLLWLIVAHRWREAEYAYHRAVKDGRTHHRYTGKPLAASTLKEYQGLTAGWQQRLNDELQNLADTPTPAYRDWCAMVRK
jgi:hypothetical protein